MSDLYAVIRDMSAGNAETGEAWQETKIYPGTATLDEVMLWANPEWNYKEEATRKVKALPTFSNKRIILTKAAVAEALEDGDE